MNLVGTVVSLSIMGAAAPSVLSMSIAPVIAQKRAENFGVAETAAVTFAANYEGRNETPVATENCDVEDLGNRSWSVTCSHGNNDLEQTVTRAFRLEQSTGYTNPNRQFAWETPSKFSHVECPVNDPWGVGYYNEHLKAGHLDACLPAPTWSRERYLESNPDDWLFDLSSWGYGRHPDY